MIEHYGHHNHYNKLHIPDHWEQYWSKYPNGYTLLEALISWTSQVNDMITSYNHMSDDMVALDRNFRALDKELRASWDGYKDHTEKTYTDFREEILTIVNNWIATIEPTIQDTVVSSLSGWLSDGTLADIINNDVFDMKANQTDLDIVTEQLAYIENNHIHVSPTGVDDTENIKNAINALPDGGYLHLEDGKHYKVSTKISIMKPVIIIGHNALIEYIGQPDNIMFEFSSGYSGARDLRIKKDKTITGITAFSVNKVIKGLFDNINFDDDIALQTAFKMNGVKESQFTHIRLKNDLSLRTGTIFEMNYCVNNTFSDSVAGYSKYLFNITETQDPVNNNRSEGIMINGFTSYYCETVVNAPNVTMLQIDNCIFDFTQKVGINCGNGGGLYINNTWIQLMHNDNSTAVAISANFGVASVNGLYIVGNKEMTNSLAFQVANRKLSVIRNVHLYNIKFGVAGNARDIIDGSTPGAEKIKNGTVSGYMRTGNGGGGGLLAVEEESFAYVYAVDQLNINNYIFGFAHLKPGVAPRMRVLGNTTLTFGVSNVAGTQVVEGSESILTYAFITPISGANVNVPTF